MLSAYRRSGATPPFGDPRGYHGVAMEGYFWRITQAATGDVLIVLMGVNRDGDGRTWGTVGLAAHPGGFSRDAAVARAQASRHGLSVGAWDEDGREACCADERGVRVDLGADARLDVTFDEPVGWPDRRGFGGVGAAHALPGLSQYWHPHMFGARVSGTAWVGGREIDLDGAVAYAEKNWGAGGFPDAWWWGQAHGFDREDVCVAFAGGRAGIGRLRATATALVVRAGDEVVRVVRPLQPLTVRVDEQGWFLRGGGIEIEGQANGTPPHSLPVPLPLQRRNLPDAAAQHLAGEVRVSLRRRGRLIYEGVSALAGLETGSGIQPPAAPPG